MKTRNTGVTVSVVFILFFVLLAPVSAQETQVASGLAVTKGPGTTNRDLGVLFYSHGDMNIMFQGGLSEWSVSIGDPSDFWVDRHDCEGEIVSPGKVGFFQESRGPCDKANISSTTEYGGGVCVTRLGFSYHDRNNGWVLSSLSVQFYSFDQNGCNVLPWVGK